MSDSEIEELRERLALAEQVCQLVGITAVHVDSDRELALTQAWMDWSQAVPEANVRISDDAVAVLAARRTQTRNDTLRRLGVEG